MIENVRTVSDFAVFREFEAQLRGGFRRICLRLFDCGAAPPAMTRAIFRSLYGAVVHNNWSGNNWSGVRCQRGASVDAKSRPARTDLPSQQTCER